MCSKCRWTDKVSSGLSLKHWTYHWQCVLMSYAFKCARKLYIFCSKFHLLSNSEKFLKIGQHLEKLFKNFNTIFFETRCICTFKYETLDQVFYIQYLKKPLDFYTLMFLIFNCLCLYLCRVLRFCLCLYCISSKILIINNNFADSKSIFKVILKNTNFQRIFCVYRSDIFSFHLKSFINLYCKIWMLKLSPIVNSCCQK